MTKSGPISASNPQRVETLRKRSEFLRLRSGRYCHTPYFILQSASRKADDVLTKTQSTRVGYTVTSKIGNAVERNRIKRRFREVVEAVFPDKASNKHDYVLIAKRPAIDGDFAALKNELSIALDRVHAKRANGAKRKAKKGNRNPGYGTGTPDQD